MPARSAALPTGPSPAGPHLEALEAAHRELGLSYDEIAQALGANASSLHGWRAGDTGPSPVFRHRLAALAELTAAVRGLRRRPGTRTVAAWLDAPAVEVPGLGGERPRASLAAGQLERLAALVTAAVTAAAVVEPLVEPLPPATPESGRREPEGPRIRRSGRPAGARA
jgi:transcriptional regulator with XRE-family HTH domain